MEETPNTPRRRRWGCWIAAAVVFLVVAVVIIIPGILEASRSSKHRSAWQSLRTLYWAESDFRSNDRDDNKVNDYWVGDISRLYYFEVKGQPIQLIEVSIANADGAPKEPLKFPNSRSGFKFAAMKTDETGAPYDLGNGRNPEKYGVCAYPETYRAKRSWYQSSGDLSQYTFIINQDGVIWKKDLGGAPAVKWPKDPVAEGWIKID